MPPDDVLPAIVPVGGFLVRTEPIMIALCHVSVSAPMPFMPHTARALSNAMPYGHLRMLEGQTHDVKPGVIAPVLVDFFTPSGDQQDR